MEIIKTNTRYSINDTLDTWKIIGTISKDVSGAININIDITNDNASVGSAYYTKAAESEAVNVSYNIIEIERDKFVTYFDTLLASVLQYIKEN